MQANTTYRSSGLALLLVLAASGAARAQAPAIDHTPVGCIVAGQFPRFDACFAPQDEVARARVHFRAKGGIHWYFVDMKPEGPCHSGVIPKPKRSTERVDYYVDVVDRGFAEGRTAEYGAKVVSSRLECKDKMMAMGLASASILLGVPAGAPAVPFGFEAAGIAGTTSASSGSGSAGGSSASVSGGGGGGGAAVGFLLGAGAAGGAVYYFTREKDEAPAGPSYDGEWAGSTSQKQSFSFTVSKSSVVRLDTVYQVDTGNSLFLIPVQQTFDPPLPITNGSFVYRGDALTLTGRFASATAASGAVEAGRTTLTWQATRR